MSGATSGTIIAALISGAVQMATAPKAPKVQPPPPPPQESKLPDERVRRAGTEAAGMAAPSTLLTGPQGAAAASQNLGRNTLLGS